METIKGGSPLEPCKDMGMISGFETTAKTEDELREKLQMS